MFFFREITPKCSLTKLMNLVFYIFGGHAHFVFKQLLFIDITYSLWVLHNICTTYFEKNFTIWSSGDILCLTSHVVFFGILFPRTVGETLQINRFWKCQLPAKFISRFISEKPISLAFYNDLGPCGCLNFNLNDKLLMNSKTANISDPRNTTKFWFIYKDTIGPD